MVKYLVSFTQCYEENEGEVGRKNNERERGEWNEKSNHAILLGLREFECQSFLTWKEKDEEDNDTFYAQSTGKKPFNDSTNDETGNSFHALEMHELLSSAMLGTTIHDVEIEMD